MAYGSPKIDGATGAQHVAITNSSGDQIGTLANPLRNTPVGIAQVQIVDGSGNAVGVTAGALNTSGGGGGGGGAVTVANGADVCLGSTTDAAVTTDTTATISARLRGLVNILTDVWDSANDRLRVHVQNSSLAATVADGSDVALGATTDAAVSTDTTGSISGKLRGLVALIASVRDTNKLRVNIENTLLAIKQVGSAFSTGQVSIATTATQIVAANSNRARLVIVQHGTTDVYLGGSGVTTGNGALLKGVAGNQFAVRSTAAVYGIVGTGTQSISYIEETN